MTNKPTFINIAVSLREDQLAELRRRLASGDRSKLFQALLDSYFAGDIKPVYQPPARTL